MPFVAYLPIIPVNETIIIPVSMNQPLEKGERLGAIIKAIEEGGYKERATILICDYLNRHNCSEEEAYKLGDKFLEDHKEILSGFKVIRWKEFLDSREQSTFTAQLKKIEDASKEGLPFHGRMKKTWQKCFSASTLENSIKYQVEEYATILCMNEFDHIFYPKRVTDGIAYLNNSIEGRKPSYHYIKVSELKKNEEQSTSPLQRLSWFQGRNTKETKHIHIAFRVLLDQAEALLDTGELSSDSKKIFAEEMEKLLMVRSLLTRIDPDFIKQ